MRAIYSVILCSAILIVSCQKEITKGTSPVTNAQGVVNTSTIQGVEFIKDGYPYPNITSTSSLGLDEIGWHVDLETVASNFNNTPKGPLASNLGDPSLYCGGIHTVNLMAGQNTAMGTLEYANDANNLYVTYTTNPDWFMSEIHLYVGPLALIPKAGGNPPPGRFPIKSTFSASNLSQSMTYTIPLTSVLLSGFVILAHTSVLEVDADGDVCAKETAWAQGPRVPGAKNWSMYVPATLDFCGGGPADVTNGNTSNQ